jgi:hypothetical protein
MWLHYDTTINKYVFRNQINLCKYAGEFDPGIIVVDIPFKDFTDRENFYHEFSKTIELDPDNSIGNSFTLGICEIGYKDITEIEGYKKIQYSIRASIIGDIFVTANDAIEDNLIIGSINNDFITVQKEEVDLFDSNYDNVYRLYTSSFRNIGWGGPWTDSFWTNPSDNLFLVQHFIRDHFQIYNKVRREIVSDIISSLWLKPFTLVDSKFGETGVGTVTTFYASPNLYRVRGIGTSFTTMFVVGNLILVEGEHIHIITQVVSNTTMYVSADWNHRNVSGLRYAKGKVFYINGFRYCPNEVADIFYNLSLKEYVDNDNIT